MGIAPKAEDVALQAPDGVVGMPWAFAVSPVLPPQPGHRFKGVGLVGNVGNLGFTPELAGVGACFQHLAGVVACLPRLRQRNLGVDTQGQALFLAPMAVFPAPVFARLGGLQVETLFVGKGEAVAGLVGIRPSCTRCRSGAFWGIFRGHRENPRKVPPKCAPKKLRLQQDGIGHNRTKKPRCPMRKRGLVDCSAL